MCAANRAGPLAFSGAKDAESSQALKDLALAGLRKLGYDNFRGHQEAAVLAALRGQDCFVLMPTGGGKSLCYALPPLVKPGLVVVVSPLIALMQDQVASLQARGLQADFLSSTRREAERRAVYADLTVSKGPPRTRLLLVTPELLTTDGFLDVMRGLYSSGSLLMVAVDECHCVSSWGHDFRHSYRRLWMVRQELPRCPIMALTATASQRVQQDVLQQLRMRDPVILKASFNRPNIKIDVQYLDFMASSRATSASGTDQPAGSLSADPLPALLSLLQDDRQHVLGGGSSEGGGACIIYCHKRETADRVAAVLSRHGTPCRAYHAGLPDAVRSSVLEGWQQCRLDCVAATVAFGMGIDRPDVRLVVHLNLPKSLEGYYQEMGRAGRDGRPSRSVVFYSTQDRHSMEYLLQQSAKGAKAGGKGQAWRKGGRGSGSGEQDPQAQLQAFGQVVEMCLSATCRRATVLAHFGERAPAPSTPCCDACDAPAAISQTVRQLHTLGAQRRQRFAGGKHQLDFGGGWGQGRLEFESERPGEGLDFDQAGASRPLTDSDGEGIDADSGGEGRSTAAVAAKRARQAGGNVLLALERAEAQQRRSAAGQGSKMRLLNKLEDGQSLAAAGAAAATRKPAGIDAVTEQLRQNVVRQVERALAGNAALRVLLSAASLAAEDVAFVLERRCHGGAASKAAYQQQATSLLLQLRKAQSVEDVPPGIAGMLGSSSAGSAATSDEQRAVPSTAAPQAAAHGSSVAEQQGRTRPPAGVLTAEELSAHVAAITQQCTVAASATGPETEQVVQALELLAAMPVTVQLLQATGAGKQVAKLQRHGIAAVATAARAAVAAWKRTVTPAA